jgi:hypothetical protein
VKQKQDLLLSATARVLVTVEVEAGVWGSDFQRLCMAFNDAARSSAAASAQRPDGGS